jgi:hypothetical protein
MKRIAVTPCICAAMGVCTLTGAAAPTASAALPELGRCVQVEGVKEGKKTVYHGNYGNKGCTREKPGAGKYEWSPEAGTEKTFSGAGSAEAATLETVGGRQIACGVGRSEGEYTGAKTEKLTFTLNNCEETALHVPCQSVNPEEKEVKPIEGTIKTLPLEGELGFISAGEKPVVGWAIKPAIGSDIAVFECGTTLGLGTKVVVEGAFITTVKRPLDRMAEEFHQRYAAIDGKQTPEQLEGGTADTLTASFLTGLEKTSEEAGYIAKEELYVEEPLEIKAKL